MHCPICGQQQISEETRFCSKCGFLLTGVAEVVSNEGLLPGLSDTSLAVSSSPRKKGIKQGLFIFLMAFLFVPLAVAVTTEPTVATMIAILTIVGGMLRMVYALMFESNIPGGRTLEQNIFAGSQNFLNKRYSPRKLPAEQSISASSYATPATGTWRNTNDLQQIGSVTENTTKLLEKEQQDTQ